MNTDTTILENDGEAETGVSQVLHVLVMSPDAFVSLPLPDTGTVAIGRASKCPVRLDDPLASRKHARLHVDITTNTAGLPRLHIEDLASANGTRVRDTLIAARELVPFLPGEAITIGSTVLMVQQSRPAVGLRRLWSHGYFESRLEDECARTTLSSAATSATTEPETAAATPSSALNPDGAAMRFALARLRIVGTAPWTAVVPVVVRTLPLPHLFAAYGPRDYEFLFVDSPPADVSKIMEAMTADLLASGIEARHGVAWYPRDGRSAGALLARANALVKEPTTTDLPSGKISADPGSVSGAGMTRIRDLAKRAATANINVLILGETGVGKDVLAKTVHRLSRRSGEFVALNCAGLAPTLIESELFGHEKGAFSGATGARVGLLEAAHGGTVFLDEIGEMPPSLQVKLLRAIDTRQILPVGGVKPRAVDVRFVAATNRDLEAEVARGTFRQDLFFRLNTLVLSIPPLRERTDEIPTLIGIFIEQACRESGRTDRPEVTAEAMRQLIAYSWPGNIRELRNIIERALVLSDGPEIAPEHLPLDKMRGGARPPESLTQPLKLAPESAVVMATAGGSRAAAPSASYEDTAPSRGRAFDLGQLPHLDDPLKLAERTRILDALVASAWNQTRAAQSLGMPRRTFVSKLEYYRIPRPQKTGGGDSDVA